MNNIKTFVKERDEALFSLDRDKILAHMKKWCDPVIAQAMESANDIVFWGAIYKAISGIVNAPKELKDKANEWLAEHGMTSYDDTLKTKVIISKDGTAQ